MRVCIQRVTSASVKVAGETVGQIDRGLLVLLGVAVEDTDEDARQMAEKTCQLRIFPDPQGKMNLSLEEIRGGLLVVSQFTLLGDCRKGRRPSFIHAAPPELGEQLYQRFVDHAARRVPHVATGVFRAQMEVALVNDGPVTILLDSGRLF